MIRVALAEDQALIREMMVTILSRETSLDVVGTAINGEEAIQVCKIHRPDVLLMDIKMPVMDGVMALQRIKKDMPKIKVILLTTFENANEISSSFCCGVDGYLLKDLSPEELIKAVQCVQSGLFVMSESVKNYIQREFTLKCQSEAPLKVAVNNDVIEETVELDSVEIKMIKLIAKGMSNKEIGETLGFTEGTIKNKITKILGNLQLKDRTQLVVYALSQKII